MELNLYHHISSLFNDLSAKIDRLAEQKKSEAVPLRSEQIDQLGVNLAKAQGEFKIAGQNKENPYFKSPYADIESVVLASRPALTKYGLSVIQNWYDDEDSAGWLETMLLHGESGQWIMSRKRVTPINSDIQTINSHVSCLKRAAYAALIGVVTPGS